MLLLQFFVDQQKRNDVEQGGFELIIGTICSLNATTFGKSWMPLQKNQIVTKMHAINRKKLLALHLNGKIDL